MPLSVEIETRPPTFWEKLQIMSPLGMNPLPFDLRWELHRRATEDRRDKMRRADAFVLAHWMNRQHSARWGGRIGKVTLRA